MVCLISEAVFEPFMSSGLVEAECSCDLLLFKSPLNWGRLIYLSAPPQNYPPDVFTKSITHISRPDIWICSYITHVLLIYAPPSIMRDICRDNHRCADRAYVSWASLVDGSLFRHHHHLNLDASSTNIYRRWS